MGHRRPDTNASQQLHSDQLPLSPPPRMILFAGDAGELTTVVGSLAYPANTAGIRKLRRKFITIDVLEAQKLAARFADSGERVQLDRGRPASHMGVLDSYIRAAVGFLNQGLDCGSASRPPPRATQTASAPLCAFSRRRRTIESFLC